MSAIVFRSAEIDYRKWLSDHQDGYVLNTSRSPRVRYMSLHRAACRLISDFNNNKPGAFTERGYIKVCSTDPELLRAWISSEGGREFTTICSKCHPTVLPAATLLPSQAEFESRVAAAREDTTARRRARLADSARIPTFTVVPTIIFDRNADVVAEVLERAAGICWACKENAPFKRRSDGSPYLEVHHQVRLADGGEDSIENAVALCPTCHRREHFGRTDG